ncbi:MAG: hypothetical protein CFK49_10925 [Armatimonadetes bacterium JP3_11]|nr:MAG: hypothetical protein CFK49_10925 [Armatimonadetes bacterium JP3_11]
MRPIPANRRWLANQHRIEPQPSAPQPIQAARCAPQYSSLSPEQRLSRRARLLGRVLTAQMPQACLGCGQPIQEGDRITLHPDWDVWVHANCRNATQIAPRLVSIASRAGVCAHCRRPWQPGQRIARHEGSLWMHDECVP